MSYPAGFSRFFLVVLNIGFWFLGGAALGAGIFVKLDKRQLVGMLARIPYQGETVKHAVTKTSLLDKSALSLILLGTFIFVIGASGMYGAMKQSIPLLYFYVSIVTAILFLEIAALATSLFFKSMVQSRLKIFLGKTIATQYEATGFNTDGKLDTNADPMSSAWDFAMGYLECCGNTNYTDFITSAENWNSTYEVGGFVIDARVPPVCCKLNDHSKFPNDMTRAGFVDLRGCLEHPRPVNANLEPCYDKLYAVLLEYVKIGLMVVASVVIIEIVAIVATIVLIKQITLKNEEFELSVMRPL